VPGFTLQLQHGLHLYGCPKRHLPSTTKIPHSTYGSAVARLAPRRDDVSAREVAQKERSEPAVQVTRNAVVLSPAAWRGACPSMCGALPTIDCSCLGVYFSYVLNGFTLCCCAFPN